MAFSTSSFERRSRVSRAITDTMPIVRRSRASLRAAAFGLLSPATWFSKDSHFLELAAVKNGGTSLYRWQLAEKQRFSTSCQIRLITTRKVESGTDSISQLDDDLVADRVVP
jgi:hypothetical protein